VFPDELRTERLYLRRVTSAETPLAELYDRFRADSSGGEVFAHVPDEPFAHLGDAEAHCRDHKQNWAARESVHYLVHPKDTSNPSDASDPSDVSDPSDASDPSDVSDSNAPVAGIASAWFHWKRDTAKLGLLLAPTFWGHNYALETNTRLTKLAVERLDLGGVQIGHTADNEKSRRAVEKFVERFGGRRQGRLRNEGVGDDGPVDIVRYVVTAEDYRSTAERGAVVALEDGARSMERDPVHERDSVTTVDDAE
jgi:RimJ/RimL family protein N-acetyltransferase